MLFVDTGKIMVLNWLKSASFDLRAHLFKNNLAVLSRSTVLADLVEADFAGYAALAGIAWPAPAINGAFQGESDSPTLTYTAGIGVAVQTCYGIYLTCLDSDLVTRKLIFCHKFSAPATVNLVGDKIEKKVNLFDDNLVP